MTPHQYKQLAKRFRKAIREDLKDFTEPSEKS